MGLAVDVVLLWDNDQPFKQELEKKKVTPIIVLNTSENYRVVYRLTNIFKLMRYVRKYDIIHVHLFPAFYWVVLAKMLSFSKTKIVFTEHNTFNNRMKNQWFRLIDRFIYRRIDVVVGISQGVGDIITKHSNIPATKLRIIHNGVNLQAIQNAEPIQRSEITFLKDDDLFILQVAGFRKQKDQETLIRALSLLPANVKVGFAGSGDRMAACKKLAEEFNVSDRVIFLGMRSDIPALLKTADIVVLSSNYEGLSLSSVEGMASGNPFIATDAPGLREVVGGAGLLFEAGNEKELASHILHLMEDKTYRDSIAAACEERAAQYDIQEMVEKHVALYKEWCP